MFTLLIGGAASGKSELAESLIIKCGALPRYYIATMQPIDDESRARIARHRAMREQKSFDTVECYTGLNNIKLPQKGAALLECVSNLAANELFCKNGAGGNTVEAVLHGVERLLCQCKHLVAVSNEVFCGGCDYEGDTLRYMKVLAEINRRLAQIADNVAEIVCGQAVYYKVSD
ncbi:MAG: bifunctional adenosylcobinamide kinase/adenosylcobinamide-phosphate guanylyltransferase [Clostridia bacterium]|nr:bifunctional adenosylcobinamide kinase/adenosylcobinamide-phosphate guanylyltransferase [Clostridia bacterium]